MNITFQKGTKCRRLLACCLAALLAYGLASCSDELGGRILSGPGTLVFNVGGIAQVGAEILTRAQMEPQTLTQDLGDGTSIVYTLSLDPITATRASSSMAENTQYLVIVYEEDGQYVTQAVFKAGETGRITGLDYKKYKVVAISYNSTTEAPPTVGSSAVTVTVDPSKDLLHWTGEVNLTSGSAPEVEIAFKHRFTQLSVQVDASLTGNNIIELPATATLTPAHRGVLTLRSNGAMETTDGASPQEFSLPRSPGAQKATSDNSRFVFTGPDTDANNPVRLKFNGNVVIKAPSGDKTLTNPVATFSTVLLGGYSYTLNMRMEASKGDYYPYAGKTGYGYECTIPLGANGYNYTDKNGDSQHVDELTFLTYNLGADPELSPKEQMAYPFSDDKNIRVYGGLWQWGRKDAEHSLRDPYSASDTEHFQNAQYPSYDPINDHKFAWGTTTSWWCASDDEESNMWGNGGGYTKQTDFSYNSATPNTTANDWNPCPTGYRVPTQHEWALIINEGGDSKTNSNDYFSNTFDGQSTTNVSSHGDTWYISDNNTNVVWVRVSEGKALTYNKLESDKYVCGWAVYNAQLEAINTQDKRNTVFDAGNDLTLSAAPEPLMFLPAAGFRDRDTGKVSQNESQSNYYWTSTVSDNTLSSSMYFDHSRIYSGSGSARAHGASVRCVKELPNSITVDYENYEDGGDLYDTTYPGLI